MSDTKLSRGFAGAVLKLLGADDVALTVTSTEAVTDHYLDIVVRTGRGQELLDVDELFGAVRAGLVSDDVAEAAAAMLAFIPLLAMPGLGERMIPIRVRVAAATAVSTAPRAA